MELIKVENYSFKYSLNKDKFALKNINFSVNQGEIITFCGLSGSGKSTLLRCLKKEVQPSGISDGKIISSLSSKEIAIVFQNFEAQLINSNVLDNLVFHMENLGYSHKVMKKKLSETVSFFGIENLLDMDINSLSGGQKQLIAICSELMIYPKILLLDEPLSQLDPISGKKLIDTIVNLNNETGITVIIAEHKMDDIIGFSNKIGYINNGELILYGNKETIITKLWQNNNEVEKDFIPQIPKLCLASNLNNICYTPKIFKQNNPYSKNEYLKNEVQYAFNEPILKISDLVFFFSSEKIIIKKLCLEIFKGESLIIFGGNGAGKSTLLKILAKIYKPFSGNIKTNEMKFAYMPQNLKTFFIMDSVENELKFSSKGEDCTEFTTAFSLEHILDKHPFDLSGGEMQKVVLACLFLTKPPVMYLDEPTKSLDNKTKKIFAGLLKKHNITAIIATHDVDFASNYGDRGAMLFNGEISYESPIDTFFKYNKYYTTTIGKAVNHITNDVFTLKEAVKLWK